jgi:hypothetical protein
MLEDPNDYKALLTPRRSGKSYIGGAGAIHLCLKKPGARVMIIGLSLNSAKQSFWRIMDGIVTNYGLDVEFNRTDLSLTFANGSYIRLYGAETEDRIERIRGDEFDLAIVDEAASFSPHVLSYLIHEVLDPAVGTRSGEIWMIGTPGHMFESEFFLATNPGEQRRIEGKKQGPPVGRWYKVGDGVQEEALWSTHKWTMADNTKVKLEELPDGTKVSKQWLRALLKKKRMGWRDDHPSWRREYLGEWTVDEDGLVYALGGLRYSDPARVVWVPETTDNFGLPLGEWSLLLGIDLGFEDPTAFVVCAVSSARQEMRELHSERHQHLTLSGVRDVYLKLLRQYGAFDAVIVDPSAKQSVETLMTDYGIPCVAAERTSKMAYIQALNSDFHSGRIKILEGSPLCEEMTKLAYDLSNGAKEELSRKGTLRENPKMDNHCSDAFLYLWRYSCHRWEDEKQVEGPPPGSNDWFKQREREAFEAAAAERMSRYDAMDEDEWIRRILN